MLAKGTISNVLDDFFELYPVGHPEIQRALDDFFGNKHPVQINEMQLAVMNEWLVFDFRLNNGLTVLEDYCHRRESEFSGREKKTYLDLCSTNRYGAFEVLKVYRDKGLDIRDLRTGQDFFVQEKALTQNIRKGNIFLNRVARTEEYWELVGADPAVLPITKSTKPWKEMAFGGQDPITPRLAFSLLADDDEEALAKADVADLETARKNFSKALKKFALADHISPDIVADWWQKNNMKPLDIVAIMQYLAVDHGFDDDFNELIEVFFDFQNNSPNEKLGGKTPRQKMFENPNYRPQLHSDARQIGDDCWYPFVQNAHKLMNQNDFLKALKIWKKAFAAMRKNFVVRPDTFRFFANKAVCHFACGQRLEGAMMLDIALELNPNYSFALKMKDKFDKGDYDEMILFGSLDKLGKLGKREQKKRFRFFLEEDPAMEFYYFIKNLKINFATKGETKDKVSIIGAKTPGRNEPYPCGSGKKYKKCCGK